MTSAPLALLAARAPDPLPGKSSWEADGNHARSTRALGRKVTIAMADEEYIDWRLEHMAEEALVKARRKR